jgi:hypothetical protein
VLRRTVQTTSLVRRPRPLPLDPGVPPPVDTGDRVFANAQTGNVVLFAPGLIHPDIAAPPHLWPVLAFIAGVALAQTLHNPADAARPPRPRRWVLIAEVVVLGFIAAAPSALPLGVIVSLISFFSALRLSLFRTVESLTFVPIAMTGNLSRATEAIHAAASAAQRERRTAVDNSCSSPCSPAAWRSAQSPPRISAAAPPRFPLRCSHSTSFGSSPAAPRDFTRNSEAVLPLRSRAKQTIRAVPEVRPTQGGQMRNLRSTLATGAAIGTAAVAGGAIANAATTSSVPSSSGSSAGRRAAPSVEHACAWDGRARGR